MVTGPEEGGGGGGGLGQGSIFLFKERNKLSCAGWEELLQLSGDRALSLAILWKPFRFGAW